MPGRCQRRSEAGEDGEWGEQKTTRAIGSASRCRLLLGMSARGSMLREVAWGKDRSWRRRAAETVGWRDASKACDLCQLLIGQRGRGEVDG